MTTKLSTAKERNRIRSEIAETARDFAAAGLMNAAEAEKITARMLGPDALPPAPVLKPKDIVSLRERERMSQAVFAKLLDVTISTLSKWERGEAEPGGPARRLLQVVKVQGAAALMRLG